MAAVEDEKEELVALIVVAGELLDLGELRGIVAILLGIGLMAKMSLELLLQAKLPGPLPCVSQQL